MNNHMPESSLTRLLKSCDARLSFLVKLEVCKRKQLWRASCIFFLWAIICCHMSIGALFGERAFEHVREKTKRAYVITRKKTRTWYERAKKHKQLIAAAAAYASFEFFAYYQSWDTPLRRLLTPKKLLDDANQTIQELTKRNAELEKEAFDRQHQALMEQMDKFLNQ